MKTKNTTKVLDMVRNAAFCKSLPIVVRRYSDLEGFVTVQVIQQAGREASHLQNLQDMNEMARKIEKTTGWDINVVDFN